MELVELFCRWVKVGERFEPLDNGPGRERLYKKWVALEKKMHAIATLKEIQKVADKEFENAK